MNLYKYLFYRFYLYYDSSNHPTWPHWEALLSVCLLNFMNFYTLILVFSNLIGFDFPELIEFENEFLTGCLLLLPFLIFNYYLFIMNKKYIQVIDFCKINYNIKNYKRNGILIISYILLSMFFLVMAMIYKESTTAKL